jgi:uncharacterized protein (DUF1778 family)
MSDDLIEKPARARQISSSVPVSSKGRAKADAVMQTRISTMHRDLISDAAALRGVSRSKFVVDTLVEKSEKILLETLLFQLNQVDSAALAAIFDNPPEPTEALRELMFSKAPWE